MLLLEGKLGDALFLMRKILKEHRNTGAADYVRGRFDDLGETP